MIWNHSTLFIANEVPNKIDKKEQEKRLEQSKKDLAEYALFTHTIVIGNETTGEFYKYKNYKSIESAEQAISDLERKHENVPHAKMYIVPFFKGKTFPAKY
jgi:hypothetical protein